jgi:mono/diheme cytochrome c family protein
MTYRRSLFSTLAALLTLFLVFAAGCNKDTGSGAGGPSGGNPAPSGGTSGGTAPAGTQTASAEGLFTANCANCHKMGSLGGGRSPDLSQEGAKHDAAWIATHIKDAKTHNPNSKMPPFGSKLSETDIQTLATHLASLK